MGNRLKRVLSLTMAVFMLFMTAVPSYAAEGTPDSDKTVRMGYFEFGGMFEGARAGARKSGYCYEYMSEVSTYTGWKYKFVYGSYSELYEKLKNGEIDILPYTNYNDQRGREVLFSDKALAEEEYYIAVNDSTVMTADSLNGGIITTLEGADYNELLLDYIKEKGLNLTVKYYPNLDETWNAVLNGEAAATVFTSNAYSEDGWNCIDSFGKKPTYIAVAKNRPDLLEALNEATGNVDIDNPALLGNLYAKYFSDNPMRRSLSAKEQEWINAHPVIHVGGFVNDAPYFASVDNETHTATGMSVDLVNGIIVRLGLNVSADFTGYSSLEEMYDALDDGRLDVIIPYYPSQYIAQQNNLIISKNVRTSNMELVYLKGTSYEDALKKIATPATKLGMFYVQDTFPDCEAIGAVSIQDAVDKVLMGEAKGAVAQNVVMHSVKENYDTLNSVVLSEGCGTCFAARPKDFELIRILNRGLNYYDEAEISSIAAKYSLEPTVTTAAYLATHKEAVIMLIVIFITLVGLATALIQMSKLKKKADEASNSKSSFLFNMSHDIRTPMNAIKGFTAMAKKNLDDKEKARDYLDKIDISGKQLLTLVNQILEMARIESGKIELEEKPVDVRKEFGNAVTVLSEQARENGLTLNYALQEAGHVYILADAPRMSSITLNVVGNAMKYTPRGGRIDFTLKEISPRKDGYATYVFTVEDTGIGMSNEYQKHLFEPFSRENNSTVSRIQGAGLGMSIVKNLVDLMGGEITVKSESGKGTRFDITLDFKIDDEADSRVQAEPVKEETSFEGCRVLLVEDNELNREIASDLLSEQGLIIEEACDGNEAVEILRTKGPGHYDFILMDIQMPVMNGYEATKAIREMYPDDHIPIIALSANAFTEDKAASLAAGMDDHVAKPIDTKALFSTLAEFRK